MNSKLAMATAIASVVMLVVVGMNTSLPKQGQQLTGTISGQVLSAGTQSYEQKGGKLVAGEILGSYLDPSKTKLTYSFDASLAGLTATGGATIELTGWTLDSTAVHMTGKGSVNDMIPAFQLPLGCDGKATPCTSAVPAFFIGLANLYVTVGGNKQNLTTPFVFESAYLNPFGASLLIAVDPTTWMTTTYTEGKISWTGVVVGGTISGSLGSTAVVGAFTQISRAQEDLVSGNETETGSITFTGMTPSSLNSAGQFSGSSTIPAAGFVCPVVLGVPFPMPPGTCTETGLSSQGRFSMSSKTVKLSGTYKIDWPAPAFSFGGTTALTTENP